MCRPCNGPASCAQDRCAPGRRAADTSFRETWIAGVKKHYPGQPKPGYIASWEETPKWERESAAAVYDQVRAFIEATHGQTTKLSRIQKGRFVALCWIGQIFKHFPDPKPSYVADWDDLPQWQRQTDADIFERIEQETLPGLDNNQDV